MSIGTEIRARRKFAGLTQAQLSDLSGVPQGRISEYERDRRTPSVPTLRAIEAVLGPVVVALTPMTYEDYEDEQRQRDVDRQIRDEISRALKMCCYPVFVTVPSHALEYRPQGRQGWGASDPPIGDLYNQHGELIRRDRLYYVPGNVQYPVLYVRETFAGSVCGCSRQVYTCDSYDTQTENTVRRLATCASAECTL